MMSRDTFHHLALCMYFDDEVRRDVLEWLDAEEGAEAADDAKKKDTKEGTVDKPTRGA